MQKLPSGTKDPLLGYFHILCMTEALKRFCQIIISLYGWQFLVFLLTSADLSKSTFSKISENYQCQTVWTRVSNSLIQIRTDILSVLIWVKTVCKCYQQMTKVTASKERVKLDRAFALCCSLIQSVPKSLVLAPIKYII